jgi:hypothetical protein
LFTKFWRPCRHLLKFLEAGLRIPTKPAMHSNSKSAGYSDLKPATRGVVRMGQFHDVVEGWEGQETG